jgi:hypothetical protein
VDSATIVVTAHNRRAVTRLRAALANVAALKPYPVMVELADGAQELDAPITPPRAASLALLDSLTKRFARHRIAVDAKTLPAGLKIDDLTSRGLRASTPEDTGCTTRVLQFREPRMFEDGRVMYTVYDGERDLIYEMFCARGKCESRYDSNYSGVQYANPCKGRWQDIITGQ